MFEYVICIPKRYFRHHKRMTSRVYILDRSVHKDELPSEGWRKLQKVKRVTISIPKIERKIEMRLAPEGHGSTVEHVEQSAGIQHPK
jgi:hypothetical protein